LQLPTDLTESRLEFEVECKIDSKYELLATFVVHLTPAKPERWKILLSPDTKHGIQCDPGDLATKVFGVWLIDQYDNSISGDFLPSSLPSLRISWTNDDTLPPSGGAQELELILEDTDPPLSIGEAPQELAQIRKYVLPSNSSLICDRPLPAPFWLWAYDQCDSYLPCVESLTAVASYPSKIFFRCPSIFGEASIPSHELGPLPFTNTSKIDDLQITLLDSYDHEASLNNLQELRLRISTTLTSEIVNLQINDLEVELFQKKISKNPLPSVSIDFSKLTRTTAPYRPLKCDELFELDVTCSYLLNSKRVTLRSTLFSKFLILNLVTKLHPSYTHHFPSPTGEINSSSSNAFYEPVPIPLPPIENGIQCGEVPVIKIVFETEDHEPIEIISEDIEICLSYRDGDGKERPSGIDMEAVRSTFHADCSSDTNQTVVTYRGPLMTCTGKYSFHFKYSDTRPKMTTNRLIPSSLLKVSFLVSFSSSFLLVE
jgi:hypothetical protein